ncbi:MAG: topoisomerase 1, partial [Pseudomonadota bacterium]
LEEKLDLISDNKLEWKDVLRDFWREFMSAVEGTKELTITQVLEALNEMLGPHIFPAKEDGGDPRACPSCGTGQLSLKISRANGAFIGCGNYPECRYTRQLSQMGGEEGGALLDGKELGFDPQTGFAVTLRNGRFGTYLQLGEATDYDDEKPKRSSIPKGIDPAALDLETALKLLALPRQVGQHPDGGTIAAGLGRYGPFILHENGSDKVYVNLESIHDVFEIGVNRAVTLLAEKKAGGGRGRFQRAAPAVLKDLGEHPDGGKIEVLSGRYGPYVKHNKINATIPKNKEPTELTVAEAIELLAARAEKAGTGRKAGGRKSAPKKTNGTEKKPESAAKSAKKTAKKTAATKSKTAAKPARTKSKQDKAEAQ